MKDMVPKGTGDSRYLKSVANFTALYPTYADFVAALVAGTLPVDFNGINSAGCNEVGTPLNKASLLTDATFAKMGVTIAGAEPTVNDALDALAELKAGLDSNGKVLPDQLSSRVVSIALAAGDSLTLDSSYKNTFINVSLPSASGTASIIVPDNAFNVGDEFEVCIRKNDANIAETLTITRASGAASRFNGLSSVSLSNSFDIAALKCYGKEVAPAGASYGDYLLWVVKGDI